MKKKRAEAPHHLNDRNLLVRNANVWTRNGITRGSILIEDGRIKRVARKISDDGEETINATGLLALPGLVDVHVHLRDMKLAYKEDFATGTAAAAAGGFTTLLDMPNTLPPTDSARRLEDKQRVAANKTYVKLGFHAAATADRRTINELAEAGAFSLKLYLPKPISPFEVENDQKIREMMIAAGRSRIPVTVHAEEWSDPKENRTTDDFETLANRRSPSAETRAVHRILRIQRNTDCQVHFCHLTLLSSLERIGSKRPKLSSEVTPHHLLLSKNLLSKIGSKAWMVPPLRSELQRRNLLRATASGLASVIASDHAPHALREKNRRPGMSPPGIPGLETTLPLMLTLVNRGIFSIKILVRFLVENPAKIFSITPKPTLQPGSEADLVLIDLKRKSRIDSSKFYSKAKFSPFDGFETRGAVDSTIVDGRLVYYNGMIVAKQGCGRVLRKGESSRSL